MKRILIPSQGPQEKPIKLGISLAAKACENLENSINVVLLTPTKNLSGTIEEALGRKYTKELEKGNKLKMTDNSKLSLESIRTFESWTKADVIVAIHADKKMLDKIDSNNNFSYVFVVPWIMDDDIEEWIRTWNPDIYGEKNKNNPEKIIENPVVEKALESLTSRINLSTGLGHPLDKNAAVDLFRLLHKNNESFDPKSIRAWAVKNGWRPDFADKLQSIAQAIIDRKSIKGGQEKSWNSNLINILRNEVKNES